MSAPLAIFYPEGHVDHAQPGHPERPDRVEAIRKALEGAGLWEQGPGLTAISLSDETVHAVHDPALLRTLEEYSRKGQNYDLDTYLTPDSYRLALQAAGGAAAAAQAVWRGEADCAFALTRPPGHHATRRQAMGFCLLNNIALAAEHLLQAEGAQRLAILDLDVHHGNGTQDIFWERGEVLFISSHQSPLYPGTGMLDERGAGDGNGSTCNLPLPPFSGDEAFRVAYQEIAIPLLERFQPEMLLVSFGFDAHWRDPLANLLLSAAGLAEQITALRAWAAANCRGRIAVFLEGGYDLDAARVCTLAITQALLGQPWDDALGSAPRAEGQRWREILDTAKQIWELR